MKTCLGFFLLLTWYRSVSESLTLLVLNVCYSPVKLQNLATRLGWPILIHMTCCYSYEFFCYASTVIE